LSKDTLILNAHITLYIAKRDKCGNQQDQSKTVTCTMEIVRK